MADQGTARRFATAAPRTVTVLYAQGARFATGAPRTVPVARGGTRFAVAPPRTPAGYGREGSLGDQMRAYFFDVW